MQDFFSGLIYPMMWTKAASGDILHIYMHLFIQLEGILIALANQDGPYKHYFHLSQLKIMQSPSKDILLMEFSD